MLFVLVALVSSRLVETMCFCVRQCTEWRQLRMAHVVKFENILKSVIDSVNVSHADCEIDRKFYELKLMENYIHWRGWRNEFKNNASSLVSEVIAILNPCDTFAEIKQFHQIFVFIIFQSIYVFNAWNLKIFITIIYA